MRRAPAGLGSSGAAAAAQQRSDRWRGVALLGAAGAILAALGSQARAPEAGVIGFTAAQMGSPLQGSFESFTVQVDFDPAHPEKGAVHVQVPVDSVSAGSREANDLLRSTGFFDVAHFPTARFDAEKFVAQADGHYLAQGSFTLKGRTVTQPIIFSVAAGPQGRWFEGHFSVSRLAFDVGQGEWSDTSTLDDKVEIAFHVPQGGR